MLFSQPLHTLAVSRTTQALTMTSQEFLEIESLQQTQSKVSPNYEPSTSTGQNKSSLLQLQIGDDKHGTAYVNISERLGPMDDFNATLKLYTTHIPPPPLTSGRSYVRVLKLIQWLESETVLRGNTTS